MKINFTLNAGSDLISIIVRTVSCKIELPAFLVVSVFVQTWASISFMASLASASFLPKTLNKRIKRTCKNGSLIPDTSWSGL